MFFESGLSYMLTYIATAVFSFLGVYVGALLAFISPEELKPGKMYFRAFMNTILVFIILLLLYSYNANIYALIFLGVSASVFLYFTHDNSPINQVAYFLLGFGFYFSARSQDLLIAISTLIFLYGLPLGSLFVANRQKQSKRLILTDILLHYGFFVVVALMTNLFFLFIYNY